MKCISFIVLFSLVFISKCKNHESIASKELSVRQVMDTEKEFEAMTAEKGWTEAFYYFADDSAVIQRGDRIIKGRSAIREYFLSSTLKNVNLKWDADFADVSNSGDMAYTYGKYTFTAIDSIGNEINSKGIFHSVWKKQSDGSWKYVWD